MWDGKKWGAALICLSALVHPTIASAQALSPMRLHLSSFEDVFSVKVHPKNPYKHRIDMRVQVFDQNFKLVRARVTPRTMKLGAGASRTVTVVVPFEGKKKRKVRICATAIPFPKHKKIIRTRVCGRFFAQRVQ